MVRFQFGLCTLHIDTLLLDLQKSFQQDNLHKRFVLQSSSPCHQDQPLSLLPTMASEDDTRCEQCIVVNGSLSKWSHISDQEYHDCHDSLTSIDAKKVLATLLQDDLVFYNLLTNFNNTK